MITVYFNDKEYECYFDRYANGNIKLSLGNSFSSNFIEVTVPDFSVQLSENKILIKDYSENQGIAVSLMAAGVIEREPDYKIVKNEVFYLTEKGLKEKDRQLNFYKKAL